MCCSSKEHEETLVSIQERIFKIGYARELRSLAALGAVGVVIVLPLTYCQNLVELKSDQIDFLNSSAVGADYLNYCSYLGNKEFFIAMIPIALWIWNIPVGIVFGFLFATSLFFSAWLKELFADSRPLWFAGDNLSDVSKACSSTYGQPSSHALMSVNLLFFPFVVFVVTHSWINPWWKAMGWAIFSVLVGLVAWSRVTTAVHFPYQIALGVSVGLLFMPASLYLLAYLWHRVRGFDLLQQSISAGAILILGNLVAIFSMGRKSASFDLWIENCAACNNRDLPDHHAAMNYVLGATGMLAVYPYILCYHQAHELEPATDKSIWCVMLVCFTGTMIIVVPVSIIWDRVITIDAVYWKGILKYEVISGIITTLLALFLPMLFHQMGMLQVTILSDQKQISADTVEPRLDVRGI